MLDQALHTTPDTLTISIAEEPAVRESIFRFRYEVYIAEMGKQLAAGVDHDARMLTDAMDDTATLFYAERNGQVVGTLRRNRLSEVELPEDLMDAHQVEMFSHHWPPATLTYSSRLMIDSTVRKTLTLPKLLIAAYEHAIESGVAFDFCNCTPDLVRFYQALGYRRYTENHVDTEIGFRVPLVMMARDNEHLSHVRSPLWRTLKKRPALWVDQPSRDWFNDAFKDAPEVQVWELDEDDFWDMLSHRFALTSRYRALRVVDGELVEVEVRD